MSINLDQVSDADLIAELQKRKPDHVLLPRNPSRIMALRGLQGDRVVKDDEFDLACDYMQIYTKRMPHVNGFDEGDIWVTLDEREFLVIASIYRGCIQGYEEWERLRAKEPDHGNLPYWDAPVTTPNLEDLTYDQPDNANEVRSNEGDSQSISSTGKGLS